MHDTSAIPKRRVASFATSSLTQQLQQQEQQPQPQHLQQSQSQQPTQPLPSLRYLPPDFPVKRRRISTSPELERRGVNFTPATSNRFSREPPSPGITSSGVGGGHGFFFAASGQAHSQATSSNQTAHLRQKRGTTPFAYATPHSNLESTGWLGDDNDGDTEVNTAPSEHEWEGVQETADDGHVRAQKRRSVLGPERPPTGFYAGSGEGHGGEYLDEDEDEDEDDDGDGDGDEEDEDADEDEDEDEAEQRRGLGDSV